MNFATNSGLFASALHRLMLGTRYLGGRPLCKSFGAGEALDTIQRIYVINLDRMDDRWRQTRGELHSLRDQSGRPLTEMSRRFSAVDARYYLGPPNREELQPYYSLADQLFVEPHPLLEKDEDYRAQCVEMTRQEVAVALSHVAVWKAVAESGLPFTLVLEDDVYFGRGFTRTLDRVWEELVGKYRRTTAFDLLYLSYMEARTGALKEPVSELVFIPRRGLWWLSGYVLSARGAQRLLDLLPVRGPVDLWVNHQFEQLDVFATQESIIGQRLDFQSTNSYSILPILSKVGVLTSERPLLFKTRALPGPVFAFGKPGSGLTALAMALSMLGYRCCSDITHLPESERDKLFGKKRGRVFDAYVNIGSLGPREYLELAKTYPQANYIMADEDEAADTGVKCDYSRLSFGGGYSSDDHEDGTGPYGRLAEHLKERSGNVLVIPKQHRDKWELLCRFLGCDYPSDLYPECEDQRQRGLAIVHNERGCDAWFRPTAIRSDSSPWITPRTDWCGIPLFDDNGDPMPGFRKTTVSERFKELDPTLWTLRDDTFPSNLALFRPDNFAIGSDKVARLTLREERNSVRDYTSAAICSRQGYLYGRFVVDLKPAKVPGLITGVFLHRNAPRQEIDIEFLGKDTTKLLLNVYYNPGADGAHMEYGYRGTPVLIDLGFDASLDFHRYEIEWTPTSILWHVDGRLAFKRVTWDPTPISHLPMQLNVNLWHSRSEELAGQLAGGALPAQTELRAIEVFSHLQAPREQRF